MSVASIITMIDHPGLPYLVAFLIGAIVAYLSFATNYPNRPVVIVKSWSCHAYAIFSGLMSALTLHIIAVSEISILNTFSFETNPIVLAILVGLAGYSFLWSSKIDSSEPEHGVTKPLVSLFLKIKIFCYDKYLTRQLSVFRPQVWAIVKNIDNDNFYDFFRKCIHQATEINKDKGDELAVTYSEHKKNGASVDEYKCSLSISIATIVGLDLLKQVALEANAPENEEKISELDATLQILLSNRQGGHDG